MRANHRRDQAAIVEALVPRGATEGKGTDERVHLRPRRTESRMPRMHERRAAEAALWRAGPEGFWRQWRAHPGEQLLQPLVRLLLHVDPAPALPQEGCSARRVGAVDLEAQDDHPREIDHRALPAGGEAGSEHSRGDFARAWAALLAIRLEERHAIGEEHAERRLDILEHLSA
eukprot:1824325-Prymnesium_polylepis.1